MLFCCMLFVLVIKRKHHVACFDECVSSLSMMQYLSCYLGTNYSRNVRICFAYDATHSQCSGMSSSCAMCHSGLEPSRSTADWASNVPSSSVAKHGDATQITRQQCCNYRPRSPLSKMCWFGDVWVWGYHLSRQASKAQVFDVLLVVVQGQLFLALMGINITVASSGLSVGILCKIRPSLVGHLGC